MFIREPAPTPYDLHLRIAGIPIRVHPFFWLVGLILGAGLNLGLVLVWMPIFFVSILLHELGHAAAIRYYGWEPWIVLHGFGGLAGYQPWLSPRGHGAARSGRSPLAKIVISAAGPAAGFAFAATVILGLFASDRSIVSYLPTLIGQPPISLGRGLPLESPHVLYALDSLLFVNIFWSAINLFPVSTLDGGHIARELLMMANRQQGERQAYILSIITAVGLSIYGLTQLGSVWMAVLFGFMAYESYQAMLHSEGRRW